MDPQRVLTVAAAMLAATSGAECFFVEGLNRRGDRQQVEALAGRIPGGRHKCCDNVRGR